MLMIRPSLAVLAAAVCLPVAFIASCGDEGNAEGSNGTDPIGGGGMAGAEGDGGVFYPPVEAADPCLTAGYFFDGESDCYVVRCPELTCECSSPEDADGSVPLVQEVTFSTCISGAGCLDRVDCARACDPALELTRTVCEGRMAAAPSESCATDDDCLTGTCREESVGGVCVDLMPCAEDGHCATGSACLFDPDLRDAETGFPTTPGACADGSGQSLCFEDADCVYGTCLGGQCSEGLDGAACTFNSNCASGFCRVPDGPDATGTCVSGEPGGSCLDDGDCSDGLHCVSGACFSDAVGQTCENDDQCASGICVASRCRAGQLGSICEDDADCTEAFCVGYVCASGTLLAPCYEPDDCVSGLVCARRACSDGSLGAPCETDADCTVLACANGTCSDGADGAECESNDECASNRCANPAGVESGECTSGAPGSVCVQDDNCSSNDCGVGFVCN